MKQLRGKASLLHLAFDTMRDVRPSRLLAASERAPTHRPSHPIVALVMFGLVVGTPACSTAPKSGSTTLPTPQNALSTPVASPSSSDKPEVRRPARDRPPQALAITSGGQLAVLSTSDGHVIRRLGPSDLSSPLLSPDGWTVYGIDARFQIASVDVGTGTTTILADSQQVVGSRGRALAQCSPS
jgi:hypothetical protein